MIGQDPRSGPRGPAAVVLAELEDVVRTDLDQLRERAVAAAHSLDRQSSRTPNGIRTNAQCFSLHEPRHPKKMRVQREENPVRPPPPIADRRDTARTVARGLSEQGSAHEQETPRIRPDSAPAALTATGRWEPDAAADASPRLIRTVEVLYGQIGLCGVRGAMGQRTGLPSNVDRQGSRVMIEKQCGGPARQLLRILSKGQFDSCTCSRRGADATKFRRGLRRIVGLE
jgi:hypothetical protein